MTNARLKMCARALLLSSALVVPMEMMGGSAAAAAQGQGGATISLNIPAQDLGAALSEFARQSRQQLLYSPELVLGKRSTAVVGNFPAEAALRRLLSGTGIHVSAASSGAFLLNGGAPQGNFGTAEAAASQIRVTSRTDRAEAGLIRGTVVDRRTGTALRGALVELREIGRSIATDERGAFRFSGLPAGRYNLRISYLGYQEVFQVIELEPGRGLDLRYEMADASDDEIVVIGQRSARAQALNQERTAENSSTVISADLLGQFTGTTISDALRRAPGVAFTPDPDTGEGQNVIVRGLGPELNQVNFNGLRLPGDGQNRAAPLNNILADSISQVTINKTLLPQHDGAGTGGLIEIETAGPLDRDPLYARLAVEGARAGSGFLSENVVAGTISARFGRAKNFGISLSGQYREQSIEGVDLTQNLLFGQYLPLQEDGTPAVSLQQIDPRNAFPFESGVNEVYPQLFSASETKTDVKDLSLNFSSEWQMGDHTNLRLDFTRLRQSSDQKSRIQQINALSGYEVMPLEAAGGESRAALVWDALVPGLNFLTISQSYNFEDGEKRSTDVLSFRGTSDFGRLSLGYTLGYATGQSVHPQGNIFSPAARTLFVQPEHLQDLAAANTVNGRLISPFAPLTGGEGFTFPLLSEAGFAVVNDPARYRSLFGQIGGNRTGENDRYTATFSSRYDFRGILDYLEAGIFYESSRSESFVQDSGSRLRFPTGMTVLDLGLSFEGGGFDRVGLSNPFALIPFDQVEELIDRIQREEVAGVTITPVEVDPRFLDRFTAEGNLAGYLQGRLNIGKFELIGGARLERVHVKARFPTGARIINENFQEDLEFRDEHRRTTESSAVLTDILPRVLLNYRPADDMVVRAGYYVSIARPAITQLNSEQNITLILAPFHGPSFNQPLLGISEGNPALRPAFTHNFDLSLEHYDKRIGAIKLAAFYKDTRNLIYGNTIGLSENLSGVELPNDPRFQNLPDNILIQLTRPENSEFPARIWGLEASLERQFTFLPGALSGFGIYANYTYSDSKSTTQLPWVSVPGGSIPVSGVPYSFQPRHSGTMSVTYSKYGLDANLSYTRQSRFITAFRPHGLHHYQDELDTLNFRGEYRTDLFGVNTRIYLEGANLLKGKDDPDRSVSVGGSGGVPRYLLSENYNGGRTIRLGAAITF